MTAVTPTPLAVPRRPRRRSAGRWGIAASSTVLCACGCWCRSTCSLVNAFSSPRRR